MSAMDELKNKPYSAQDATEKAILLLWEEPRGFEKIAEKAAEELATLRADNERLVEALQSIEHSMKMAQVPGNDKAREIELTLNLAVTALAAHNALK